MSDPNIVILVHRCIRCKYTTHEIVTKEMTRHGPRYGYQVKHRREVDGKACFTRAASEIGFILVCPKCKMLMRANERTENEQPFTL